MPYSFPPGCKSFGSTLIFSTNCTSTFGITFSPLSYTPLASPLSSLPSSQTTPFNFLTLSSFFNVTLNTGAASVSSSKNLESNFPLESFATRLILSGAESLSTLPEICPALYLVVLCLAKASSVYTDVNLETSAIFDFSFSKLSLLACSEFCILSYPSLSTSYVI